MEVGSCFQWVTCCNLVTFFHRPASIIEHLHLAGDHLLDSLHSLSRGITLNQCGAAFAQGLNVLVGLVCHGQKASLWVLSHEVTDGLSILAATFDLKVEPVQLLHVLVELVGLGGRALRLANETAIQRNLVRWKLFACD